MKNEEENYFYILSKIIRIISKMIMNKLLRLQIVKKKLRNWYISILKKVAKTNNLIINVLL